MQDCFVSNGSLAVPRGDAAISVINSIRAKYKDAISLVVLSQDWHPPGHVSFASTHPGEQSPISLQYTKQGLLCTGPTIQVSKFPDAVACQNSSDTTTLQQALWPDHCIQNVSAGPTSGAFAPGLKVEASDLVIQKGTNIQIDSYSAFFDNGGFGKTKLDEELRSRGITHVFVTGLAADYCVYYSSLDAQKLGYQTYYVINATYPVSSITYQQAIDDLYRKGVHLVTPDYIATVLAEMKERNIGSHLCRSHPVWILSVALTLLLFTHLS